MKPLIGISAAARTLTLGSSLPPQPWFTQTTWYAQAVHAAGGTPVLLPVSAGEWQASDLDKFDGFILSGGSDWGPQHYGEQPKKGIGPVDPVRDDFERTLAEHMLASGKPILGICRGIQTLNTVLGGTLWQDLPTQRPGEVLHAQTNPPEYAWHDVTLAADSRIAQAVGSQRIAVNTLHHQGIKDLAPGLVAVGHAPDGLVEAVEGSAGERFLLGVQWHPEWMAPRDENSRRIFGALVTAASAR